MILRPLLRFLGHVNFIIFSTLSRDQKSQLRNFPSRILDTEITPGADTSGRRLLLDAGGKPSTLFPPGGLVKLPRHRHKRLVQKKHAKHDAAMRPEKSSPRQHFQPRIEVQENNAGHHDHSEKLLGCPGDHAGTRVSIPGTSEIHHFPDHGRPQIIISATF